jgi:hypothetical protein
MPAWGKSLHAYIVPSWLADGNALCPVRDPLLGTISLPSRTTGLVYEYAMPDVHDQGRLVELKVTRDT